MTVKELQACLRSEGLKVSGMKAELQKRLMDWRRMRRQAADAGNRANAAAAAPPAPAQLPVTVVHDSAAEADSTRVAEELKPAFVDAAEDGSDDNEAAAAAGDGALGLSDDVRASIGWLEAQMAASPPAHAEPVHEQHLVSQLVVTPPASEPLQGDVAFSAIVAEAPTRSMEQQLEEQEQLQQLQQQQEQLLQEQEQQQLQLQLLQEQLQEQEQQAKAVAAAAAEPPAAYARREQTANEILVGPHCDPVKAAVALKEELASGSAAVRVKAASWSNVYLATKVLAAAQLMAARDGFSIGFRITTDFGMMLQQFTANGGGGGWRRGGGGGGAANGAAARNNGMVSYTLAAYELPPVDWSTAGPARAVRLQAACCPSAEALQAELEAAVGSAAGAHRAQAAAAWPPTAAAAAGDSVVVVELLGEGAIEKTFKALDRMAVAGTLPLSGGGAHLLLCEGAVRAPTEADRSAPDGADLSHGSNGAGSSVGDEDSGQEQQQQEAAAGTVQGSLLYLAVGPAFFSAARKR